MIKLIDNYLVLVDDCNYSLVYDTGRTRKREGRTEPIYKYLGYYGSLAGAIRGCREIFVHDGLKGGPHELSEALHTIAGITKRFEELLNKYVPEDDLK